MISSRHLENLPSLDKTKKLFQSLALLDAILSPDWESRYYSFDAHWSSHEMLASMRDGVGNEFFALCSESGIILKGFSHESQMSSYAQKPPQAWPGVLETVPTVFSSFLQEPAFSIDEISFCIWRTSQDQMWQSGNIIYPPGPDPDGSQELLSILDGNPKTYQSFAEEYYEVQIAEEDIYKIYQHQPLDQNLVTSLSPHRKIKELKNDLNHILYPTLAKKL